MTRIITERFAGTMLAGVHIDTYQMLNGDSWGDSELEWLDSEGQPSDYDDYDWTYDHAGICRDFAAASVAALLDQLDRSILVDAKVLDVGSPREYNFTSDWYEADWTVDMDALDAWLDAHEWSLDAYVAEHHGSYDGFYSHIPGRLSDPKQRDWTVFFLKLDAYVRAELDTDEYNSALWEAETMVYAENTTYTLRDRG